MLFVSACCPNCGAPIGLQPGQRHAICAYCDLSLLVQAAAIPGGAETGPALTAQGIPPEDIKRIKALVLDGKRSEAIAEYSRIAGLASTEAQQAVDQLVVLDVFRMMRRAPLNPLGLLMGLGILGAAVFGIEYNLESALRGDVGAITVLLLCVALFILKVRSFVPKAVSTFVYYFGKRGKARVVRRSILQANFRNGGAAVLVLFEVHPPGGGAPFFDEESLLVRSQSLEKLEPGNWIRVRYDEPRRGRVFPVSPIEVLSGP